MEDHSFTILVINPHDDINDVKDVEVITTDNTNLSSDIVIGLNNVETKLPIHSTILQENEDGVIWQMCYIEHDEKTEKLNNLASLLTQDKKNVLGKTVIFCAKINSIGSCDDISTTIDDLKKLINSVQHHIGCHVLQNGKIKEFTYDNDLKNVIDDDSKYYDTSIFSHFNLQIFYNKNETKNINKLATLLCNQKVYGDVKIICKTNEYTFTDLNKTLLLRLRNVLRLPKEYHKLDEKYTQIEKDSSKRPIIKNRWVVLNEKEQEFKINKCWTCCNNDVNLLVCGGCYRLLYCSDKCRRIDWNNHKKDCNMYFRN